MPMHSSCQTGLEHYQWARSELLRFAVDFHRLFYSYKISILAHSIRPLWGNGLDVMGGPGIFQSFSAEGAVIDLDFC